MTKAERRQATAATAAEQVEIEIRSLKLKLEKYDTELEDATITEKRKDNLLELITAYRNTLNILMAERKQATAAIAPSGKSIVSYGAYAFISLNGYIPHPI